MYQWKEIHLSSRLQKKLKKHEEQFIHSLADIVTKTIISSMENFDLEEVETLIRQIKKNPHLIGNFCPSSKPRKKS